MMCAGQLHILSLGIGTLEVALPSMNEAHEYLVHPLRIPAFLFILRGMFLPPFSGWRVNREQSEHRNVDASVVFSDRPVIDSVPDEGKGPILPYGPVRIDFIHVLYL